SFDDFVSKLQPDLVFFDRFTTEEQFGWRVARISPKAIKVLNTEDLHFLRDARKNAIKKGVNLDVSNIRSEIAMRELAAIQRSDLSLFVSDFEIELLTEHYQIPSNRTLYLPLFSKKKDDINSFEIREGFMFIGNYFHEPNWDAVQVLKKEIWPRIKKELPNATISIYGGYAGQKVTDLNNEKDGFLVKGRVQNSSVVTQSHRISLVPLRFGAGIKGKVLEAMENGTPVVTTSIGAEAMMSLENCNGYIEENFDAFATKSVELYLSKEKWLTSQEKGFQIIQDKFSKEQFEESFAKTLKELSENFLKTRESDLQYSLFNHHSLKSSMYLSKWISEKNKA
ncbi:MAG TPA: glycosyltransferase, partial [Crocinitomicaceae bacterium]|nr:glycosyltransferase [Crocinitomicaceae bacterium]